MKVIIWAQKDEVLGNNIKTYFNTKPNGSGNWIQVVLTLDELVQIDDKIMFGEDQIEMLKGEPIDEGLNP